VPDAQLLAETIDAVIVGRPDPEEVPQHLCLDKGYDNPRGREATAAADYIPHIRHIGEEKLDRRGRKKHPARRWKVERAGSWLNGCRAILVRYAKKASNYLGLIKLDCILLWYRRAVRLAPAWTPRVVPLWMRQFSGL
jgi:putative transposase